MSRVYFQTGWIQLFLGLSFCLLVLLTSCGQQKDGDLPMLRSSKLENTTWIAKEPGRPRTDGVVYYELTFTHPGRYTLTNLDSLRMPIDVEEYGTFTIVQGEHGLRVRLYPYDSQAKGTRPPGYFFDEQAGIIRGRGGMYYYRRP